MKNVSKKTQNDKVKPQALSTKQQFGKMVEEIKMETSILKGQLNYVNGRK